MTKNYHETFRATDPPVPVLFLIMSRHGLSVPKMRTVDMKDPTCRSHKNVFPEQPLCQHNEKSMDSCVCEKYELFTNFQR